MMFRVLGVISLLVSLVGGCGRSENHKGQTPPQSKDAPIPPAGAANGEVDQASARERSRMDERLVERVRPQVQAFCTACHVMPSPEGAPKHEWPQVVDQMYMTYKDSGRTDLVVPDRTETVKFFQLQAPETKGLPLKQQEFPPTEIQWLTRGVDLGTSRPPGISHLQWIESGLADAPALVACDVNTGAVFATWPSKDASQEEREPKRLATLFQPVHAEPCDLNDDGRLDLVVADVGEFNAADSDLGQVFALIQDDPESGETVGTMQRVVLADGLGRVAEVQPGDFDGDGDIDLLVAVFGWQKTGGIVLLRRDASVEISKGSRAFRKEVIDERAGPVNVPVIDLNGDGHLDFVALVSQEHESVEAFFNDGDGKFENVVLYNAPDPSYGSTGIELVDLDGDGDVDVLYSNGDSFDRGPKRHHTVQWLENTFEDQTDWPREPAKKEGQPSRAEFVHHSLAKMPGVLRAQAGDFDGDGDLDIVAGALLATPTIQRWRGSQSPSILLLRQNGEQQFDGEIIEVDFQQHLTLEVADVDGDGTDEFAIGNFFRDGESDDPHMTWWKHPEMNSQE